MCFQYNVYDTYVISAHKDLLTLNHTTFTISCVLFLSIFFFRLLISFFKLYLSAMFLQQPRFTTMGAVEVKVSHQKDSFKMNVCSKFHGNSCNICWDIYVYFYYAAINRDWHADTAHLKKERNLLAVSHQEAWQGNADCWRGFPTVTSSTCSFCQRQSSRINRYLSLNITIAQYI